MDPIAALRLQDDCKKDFFIKTSLFSNKYKNIIEKKDKISPRHLILEFLLHPKRAFHGRSLPRRGGLSRHEAVARNADAKTHNRR